MGRDVTPWRKGRASPDDQPVTTSTVEDAMMVSEASGS